MISKLDESRKELLEKARLTSAIIISYNQIDSIKLCILSLNKMIVGPGNIIVIDNSENKYFSEEATHLLRKEGYSVDILYSEDNQIPLGINSENQHNQLLYIQNPVNRGYAAACNLGLAIAHKKNQKYCWILNADTELEQHSLSELLVNVDLSKFIGGSLVLNKRSRNKLEVESCGTKGNLFRFKNSTHIPKLKKVERFALHGCAMIVSIQIYQALQGMHEGFFMYGEETDFCIRAKQKGIKSLVIPSSVVFHISGDSVARTELNFWPLVYANHLYLVKRNMNGALSSLLIITLFVRHSFAVFIRNGLSGLIEFWRYIVLTKEEREKTNHIKNILSFQKKYRSKYF